MALSLPGVGGLAVGVDDAYGGELKPQGMPGYVESEVLCLRYPLPR